MRVDTGNVTSDGLHNYAYDAENRLASVDLGATAQYAYDADSRRIKKAVPGATTHYIWEGTQVLAEHDGSTGGVVQDYVNAGGAFVAKINANGTFYFVRDRISQRLRLDAGANVISQEGHLPFGEEFGEGGPQEKHHFATFERDSETGADYAIGREFTNGLGRFAQADKPSGKTNSLALGGVGDPQSLNRYQYSRNDPVNLNDPGGRDFCYGLFVFFTPFDSNTKIYLGFIPLVCSEGFLRSNGVVHELLHVIFGVGAHHSQIANDLGLKKPDGSEFTDSDADESLAVTTIDSWLDHGCH